MKVIVEQVFHPHTPHYEVYALVEGQKKYLKVFSFKWDDSYGIYRQETNKQAALDYAKIIEDSVKDRQENQIIYEKEI